MMWNREKNNNIRQRRTKRIVVFAAAFVVILALAGGYVYYKLPFRCVKESVTIEAGESCPSVMEFLEWECKNASIISGISDDMVFNHVKDYEVVIHLYHRDVVTTLHVVDSKPPEIQTRDKTIMLGDPFEIGDFVVNVSDVTDCVVFYGKEPDVQSAGIHSIEIGVQDEGGNITIALAQLEILQDVTPPVIEGVEEMWIMVGESVSYKRNITVTDDYDDAVKLEIDNSEVDVNTPGDYAVIYRAVDKYGNEAEVSTILHVQAPKPAVVELPDISEEVVLAEADKILASILDPSMSQYEIIKAIFDWCHSKIAYVNGTPKTDWVQGAYAGLIRRKGDCFAYAMTAKCLLDRAGITNMIIERIPFGNGLHWWNLVDIGEGWYHFDATRRADGYSFFYVTDAELMEYSVAHTGPDYPDGSHNYDRSQYPEIQ